MDKGRERVNGLGVDFQTDHWSLLPSGIGSAAGMGNSTTESGRTAAGGRPASSAGARGYPRARFSSDTSGATALLSPHPDSISSRNALRRSWP